MTIWTKQPLPSSTRAHRRTYCKPAESPFVRARNRAKRWHRVVAAFLVCGREKVVVAGCRWSGLLLGAFR